MLLIQHIDGEVNKTENFTKEYKYGIGWWDVSVSRVPGAPLFRDHCGEVGLKFISTGNLDTIILYMIQVYPMGNMQGTQKLTKFRDHTCVLATLMIQLKQHTNTIPHTAD